MGTNICKMGNSLYQIACEAGTRAAQLCLFEVLDTPTIERKTPLYPKRIVQDHHILIKLFPLSWLIRTTGHFQLTTRHIVVLTI